MNKVLVITMNFEGAFETNFCDSLREASIKAESLIDGDHALGCIVIKRDQMAAAFQALAKSEGFVNYFKDFKVS